MIHSISGPIPFHIQLWVDMREFTKDQQGMTRAIWFGLSSMPGRAWGLHVMLECGAVYRNVPPHLVAFTPEARQWALHNAQDWDCYGTDFAVVEYPYLSGLRCVAKVCTGILGGTYLFTIVPANDAFSRIPEQQKEFVVIQLANNRLTIQPTNRVLFHDRSFIEPAWPTNLKTNDRIWRKE